MWYYPNIPTQNLVFFKILHKIPDTDILLAIGYNTKQLCVTQSLTLDTLWMTAGIGAEVRMADPQQLFPEIAQFYCSLQDGKGVFLCGSAIAPAWIRRVLLKHIFQLFPFALLMFTWRSSCAAGTLASLWISLTWKTRSGSSPTTRLLHGARLVLANWVKPHKFIQGRCQELGVHCFGLSLSC